jgi:hypothetical protein
LEDVTRKKPVVNKRKKKTIHLKSNFKENDNNGNDNEDDVDPEDNQEDSEDERLIISFHNTTLETDENE